MQPDFPRDGIRGSTVDRDPLLFTDVLMETLPRGHAETGTLLRPILEQLANAAGLAEAPNFDANGNYSP